MPEDLGRNLQATCDNYMSELLDLYNCQDWGMGFVEFLERATEVTLETIGRWQNESMDEEE
jgi:hypothetical protein